MNEIQRRRTFAIISHPDAGKTTLTEKFLLFGGQIQVAGAVKNNKIRKTATSDWMDIEKQRGISVSTSVMEFDYLPDGQTGEPYKVNILDTPGHQDFAEDTYRTLTAVDSAIIVVDSAKGVEAQTRKLMEVCRMRNTPVIIFINKMDREGRDPFDVLDELEEELKIHVRPLSWPIGQGARFKGVYNIYEHQLNLFTLTSSASPRRWLWIFRARSWTSAWASVRPTSSERSWSWWMACIQSSTWRLIALPRWLRCSSVLH